MGCGIGASMTAPPPTLWTIGHSTRPIEAFIGILHAHGIRLLVDVRTIPRSRHNPQFTSEPLATSLADAEIGYRHAVALGGLRTPKKDSVNTGWRNERFRGYADYMQSDAFKKALDALMTDGREQPCLPAHAGHAETRPFRVAIMCAEAVPWRCHRSLIADALLNHGWEVRHIMSDAKADRHRMTAFAKVDEGILFYPAPQATLPLF